MMFDIDPSEIQERLVAVVEEWDGGLAGIVCIRRTSRAR
jgi:hypothetical protein